MKKNPVLIVLISMAIFSLTQSCLSPDDAESEYDQKVIIYLQSVELEGEYHLQIDDSKGGSAVDDLETVFEKEPGKSGTIVWKKAADSEIKKITEVYPSDKKTETVIFKNGAKRTWLGRVKLRLPEDITGEEREKYTIKYIPEGDNDTVAIDPWIRIPLHK